MMSDEADKIVAWLEAEADELDARACDYIEDDAAIFRREAATKRRVANRIARGDHLVWREEPTIPGSEWVKIPSVGH